MDPASSLGRIFLGENVYGSLSENFEGHGDWNAPEYTDTTGSKEKKLLDFNFDDIPQLDGEKLSPFVCKIRKSSHNKKREMENLNFFYPDIGTSLSTGRHLTQEEVAKEALALRIGQKFALLEEVRPTIGGNDDEAESSKSKRSKQYEVWKRYCFYKFIMNSYYGKVATEMQSLEIDDMLRIKLREAESNEEIFTYVAWIGAFNIKKLIYSKLCHEFYSTYEFDKVCADDELQTKKIIKFRVDGRAHSLTLLEFAHRLGLYHAEELDENGFDVYFQGGLRSDDHFNAQEYCLSISKEENLSLSRSHASTIRNPVLRVMHKMITYGLCQRTTGPLRASMQDSYERMGNMEIRQGAIERMSYRQSYHWGMYAGVFEHMAKVYSVDLQGAYNPPEYAQPQYD
nr:hypothetical protein [Tanacetum cinerariifolium]